MTYCNTSKASNSIQAALRSAEPAVSQASSRWSYPQEQRTLTHHDSTLGPVLPAFGHRSLRHFGHRKTHPKMCGFRKSWILWVPGGGRAPTRLPPSDFEPAAYPGNRQYFSGIATRRWKLWKKTCKFRIFYENRPQPRRITAGNLWCWFWGELPGGGGYRNRTDMRLLSGVFETPASASSANPPTSLLDHTRADPKVSETSRLNPTQSPWTPLRSA